MDILSDYAFFASTSGMTGGKPQMAPSEVRALTWLERKELIEAYEDAMRENKLNKG